MSLTCTLKDYDFSGNHYDRFYTSAQSFDFQACEKLAFMHKILNKNIIFHFLGAFYKIYYLNQNWNIFSEQSHKMNIGK